MNYTFKSNDAKKASSSKQSADSQQIAWYRTSQPSPTTQNRVWLILATVLLLVWLIALGVVAWLS